MSTHSTLYSRRATAERAWCVDDGARAISQTARQGPPLPHVRALIRLAVPLFLTKTAQPAKTTCASSVAEPTVVRGRVTHRSRLHVIRDLYPVPKSLDSQLTTPRLRLVHPPGPFLFSWSSVRTCPHFADKGSRSPHPCRRPLPDESKQKSRPRCQGPCRPAISKHDAMPLW